MCYPHDFSARELQGYAPSAAAAAASADDARQIRNNADDTYRDVLFGTADFVVDAYSWKEMKNMTDRLSMGASGEDKTAMAGWKTALLDACKPWKIGKTDMYVLVPTALWLVAVRRPCCPAALLPPSSLLSSRPVSSPDQLLFRSVCRSRSRTARRFTAH